MSKATLPKDIEAHLDNNILFNKFGIVNIRAVKASLRCKLPDKTLQKLINNRFAKEFVNCKIEFI